MGYSVDFISFDCYSDTTVLINKFGIRDEEKSNEVEGVITSARYTKWLSAPERRGRKNGVHDAGPLLGGFHAGHLRPRHHRRAAQGSANNGKYPIPCRLMLSATRLKCSPSQGHFHLTHSGSIPAGYSPVVM